MTDNALDPNARCNTCAQTWRWHQETKTQHAFNDGSLGASTTFGKRRADGQGRVTTQADTSSRGATTPNLSPWPFDPVLRQALVDKGIVTPQDLIDAENKIRAVTSTYVRGTGDGPE